GVSSDEPDLLHEPLATDFSEHYIQRPRISQIAADGLAVTDHRREGRQRLPGPGVDGHPHVVESD
ncbi:MAG: hypothetical protein ABGY72_08195, partial [bacterium]